jgi:hypothetical protein
LRKLRKIDSAAPTRVKGAIEIPANAAGCACASAATATDSRPMLSTRGATCGTIDPRRMKSSCQARGRGRMIKQ